MQIREIEYDNKPLTVKSVSGDDYCYTLHFQEDMSLRGFLVVQWYEVYNKSNFTEDSIKEFKNKIQEYFDSNFSKYYV